MGVKKKVNDIERNVPSAFESSELVNLIGIQMPNLNKMIEREQYGIVPSERSGRGRGRRRLFTIDDAFGVALVWWLFESGLRSGAIQYVLNQVCGGRRGSSASDAARVLLEAEAEVLVITREPRTAKDSNRDYPKQTVSAMQRSRASEAIRNNPTASVLILPVSERFSILKSAMQELK